jgi:hypothetical protein
MSRSKNHACVDLVRSLRANGESIDASWGLDFSVMTKIEKHCHANTWCPPTFTQELWDEVRLLLRAGVRVVRLKLAEPARNPAARTALPIEPDEVHVIQLLGAHCEM